MFQIVLLHANAASNDHSKTAVSQSGEDGVSHMEGGGGAFLLVGKQHISLIGL